MDAPILDRLALERLVRLAQTGDRRAFGELFVRFERHVLAVARRRLRDEHEAEELVQEVFVQALVKLPQLREPACFGGWLRSITTRMAINRAVRRAPERATEPECLEALGGEHASPQDQLLEREQADQLRSGLGRLRDLDRETLEAFYVHGRSVQQMSDDFAAPVGTIKRRLHTARQRLAREVEPLVAV